MCEPLPPAYVIHHTSSPIILDGSLSELDWQNAAWSSPFADISTGGAAAKATKVKLLYDEEFLYVGARLDENQVWGTITSDDGESMLYLLTQRSICC